MIIQRKDLVKQFELVVKQEIINHNEQIAQSNRTINELKKDVENIKSEKAADLALMKGYIKSVENSLKHLEREFDETVEKINSNNNDKSQALLKEMKLIKESLDNIQKSYLPRDIFKENFDELHRKYFELNHMFGVFNHGVDAQIKQSFCKFSEQLLCHKKEIALEPEAIKELRYELNKRINCICVDITGVREELGIQKKKQFILEKEKERLNIHLERIEAKD
jgi:hypothetical protein